MCDYIFHDNPEFLLEINNNDYRRKVSKAPEHDFEQKDSTFGRICSHALRIRGKDISTRFYHAFCVFFPLAFWSTCATDHKDGRFTPYL